MFFSKKLKIGIFWSIVEVVLKRIIDFVVKLILARLLFPEDFGIIGMSTVFTSFIQVLNDAGMGAAIIQKQNLSGKGLNTVFWTNIGWSSFLFVIMTFIIAPFAANFYDEPLLRKIVPILSISILTSALNTVHKAQLMKNLNFKKIATVNNISSLIAGLIAVYMAFLNYGIWALVANSVIAYLISVPMFFHATKWMPKLEWNKKSLKEILTFGIFITGTQVVINLVSNADYLLIGKWVGAKELGAYSLAFMMTSLVSSQITSMLNRVMFPFYSSIQNDKDALKNYYLKTVGIYAIIVYPIMITFFLFADTLVPFFFGNNWIETIVPLKLLSLAVMIDILTSGYNLVFRGIDKPKYEFKIQRITSILVYLPCLVIGIYAFGIIGAAAGALLARFLNFFIHQHVLNKHFQIRIKDLCNRVNKIMFISLIMFIIVICMRSITDNTTIVLVAYTFIFITIYVYTFKNEMLLIIRN